MTGPVAVPTLSVILCNYNHADFLPASLAAICEQSHPADEVIVVDDASTDRSVDVIEGFAARYPKLRLLRNERNLGPERSAMRALEQASGDYVGWFAADDRLMPGFFARVIAELKQSPNAGVVVGEVDFEQVGQPSQRSSFRFEVAESGFMTPERYCVACRSRYLWLATYAAFVRRDTLVAAGGWRSDLGWLADWFATCVVALREGACLVDEPFATVRRGADSYSAAGFRDAARARAVLRRIPDLLASKDYRDVRTYFRRAPLLLLTPLGPRMITTLAMAPRHWDLLVPMLATKLRLSIGHRLRRTRDQ